MSHISSIYKPGIKLLRNNKGANINVGNIPCKLLYFEAVIYQRKANTECWIFIPPLTHLYQSIEMM